MLYSERDFSVTFQMSMKNEQAGVAGMVDARSGLLGATILPASQALVPAKAELEGDYLLWWRYDADSANPHGLETSSRGMLDAFVRIKTTKDVLRFVRRYGPLFLCEHGLPAAHNWTTRSIGCYPLGWEEGVCREPLAGWRQYVEQARALIAIAAALREGKEGSKEDWQALLKRYEDDGLALALAEGQKTSVKGRRSLLSDLANGWLALTNARLSLTWDAAKSKWDLMMRGTTFALLAMQLVFAIAGHHRLVTCDGCGRPYLREKRAPQMGRRNFCPQCGKTVAARLRQRDRRVRLGKGGIKNEQAS